MKENGVSLRRISQTRVAGVSATRPCVHPLQIPSSGTRSGSREGRGRYRFHSRVTSEIERGKTDLDDAGLSAEDLREANLLLADDENVEGAVCVTFALAVRRTRVAIDVHAIYE